MQMCHSDVNPFRKSCSRLRTKAPDIKTTTVVDRSHSIPRYADFVHFTGQDDCLYVDFECFKLTLWPTLRQKFMNF